MCLERGEVMGQITTLGIDLAKWLRCWFAEVFLTLT